MFSKANMRKVMKDVDELTGNEGQLIMDDYGRRLIDEEPEE